MKFQTSCKAFQELSTSELYNIMALRQKVFVVEQNCPYLDADGLDLKAWHLSVYQGMELMAYCRLLDKSIAYDGYSSIGRVVTSTRARGKGLGKSMMTIAINKCKLLFPDIPIKISAQLYLQKFYESLGFEAVGAPYLEDNILHVAMIYQCYENLVL